ncbi:hypothetical protein AAL_00124 [Moelleriella libera RCEF 2490]|uniref:2EXR domain-containing protein n=1 Tax=Moelleriella libera RCEF 2490 TaxID=1081109 RepID=A0A166UKT3_9HYPO|nr:hypothetical protein AAL_00124 [Moelleriella libera RCEF 2490]
MFSLFPQLPPELRQNIWRKHLETVQDPPALHVFSPRDVEDRPEPVTVRMRAPDMMRVSREARATTILWGRLRGIEFTDTGLRRLFDLTQDWLYVPVARIPVFCSVPHELGWPRNKRRERRGTADAESNPDTGGGGGSAGAAGAGVGGQAWGGLSPESAAILSLSLSSSLTKKKKEKSKVGRGWVEFKAIDDISLQEEREILSSRHWTRSAQCLALGVGTTQEDVRRITGTILPFWNFGRVATVLGDVPETDPGARWELHTLPVCRNREWPLPHWQPTGWSTRWTEPDRAERIMIMMVSILGRGPGLEHCDCPVLQTCKVGV